MASAENEPITPTRAYNGGLGAEPPAGPRGRAPGQRVRGVKPP